MVGSHYRHRVREMFGMEQTWGTAVGDCCAYWWCAPCAIVQEARQIEEAYAVDHKAIRELRATVTKVL